MTEKTINCENCTREYTYEVPTNFPDKRKYCDVCSAKKKAEWTETFEGTNGDKTPAINAWNRLKEDVKPEVIKSHPKWDGSFESKSETKPKDNGVKKENGDWQSTVYNRTVAANSYEVGSAGNRFKLYFETPQELRDKMDALIEAGIMEPLPKDFVTGE